MQSVRVSQLRKQFVNTVAVADVDLTIAPGELFTLLGPSGCGKTTLLRLVAGLESQDAGSIYFGDERVDDLPTYRRNVGMVFQNYAVFPHMTVAQNVAYGLRARKMPEAQVIDRVAEALAQVRMSEYGARRPDQLSGGQQQRVALARALATRPALLLMDEPLSNLDARLRLAMRDEIRRLQRQVGITTLYVTHDQEEALAISDRIGVMEEGQLRQVGAPHVIYRHPAHQRVAAFVGTCSFIEARVEDGVVAAGGVRFAHPDARGFSGEATLGLRPESLRPHLPGEGHGEHLLMAKVVEERFLGSFVSLAVDLESGQRVTVLSLLPMSTFVSGGPVVLSFRPEELLLFDRASGAALGAPP